MSSPTLEKIEGYGEPEVFASGAVIAQPSYARGEVQASIVSILSDLSDPNQNGTTSETARARLSSEQETKLLKTLEARFEKPNPCRPAGVTFAQVRKILKEDPDLAFKLFMAEMKLGSEMDVVAIGNSKSDNVFDDFAPEVSVKKQVAFLRSISPVARGEIINNLRKQYANIPAEAFDRSDDDQRGPNKWEGLLIQKLLGLRSIPEKDYRATQAKLPREQWLDRNGISWLEENSQKQLASGSAPRGDRCGDGVHVDGRDADYRVGVRGVRVRAEGSAA